MHSLVYTPRKTMRPTNESHNTRRDEKVQCRCSASRFSNQRLQEKTLFARQDEIHHGSAYLKTECFHAYVHKKFEVLCFPL